MSLKLSQNPRTYLKKLNKVKILRGRTRFGVECKNMKLYRFSPIKTKEDLFEAIKHVHFECYKLCKQSFGYYLPNAGNMGIFCHYEDEYDNLIKIRVTSSPYYPTVVRGFLAPLLMRVRLLHP